MSAYGRPSIEQSLMNYKKIARSAIRLKHSIAADNELNEFMPVLERKLVAMAQEGKVPSLTVSETLALLDG